MDVVGDVRRTVVRGLGLRLGGARNGEIGKRVAKLGGEVQIGIGLRLSILSKSINRHSSSQIQISNWILEDIL
jgi:hypothetical protein